MMRLAVIDPRNEILVAWPRVEDAHHDICAEVAQAMFPRAWQHGRRDRLEKRLRTHLVSLQEQTRSL